MEPEANIILELSFFFKEEYKITNIKLGIGPYKKSISEEP